jgi:hydrogenase maturation factor
LLLTKGVPVEAVSILAREFPQRLGQILSQAELEEAREYLFKPGISVVRDARLAVRAGRVTAMHDPTEGGLASALWELAEASHTRLVVDPAAVPVPGLARRICDHLGIDPLASIASGALLLACEMKDAGTICSALQVEGIPCAQIGRVEVGEAQVVTPEAGLLPRPARDEIARLFEVT